MAKRIYNYHIRLNFDRRRPECSQGNKYSEYIGGGTYQDSFHFLQDHFEIIAQRGNIYPDGSILGNDQNSLYNQILKGLLYYYGLAADFPKIKSISIIRKQAHRADVVYGESSVFSQPIDDNRPKPYVFIPADLDVIFNPTMKASAIRVALSYWLKAVSSNSEFYRFEHLWRAFNRIFLFEGDTVKDFDGLRAIRGVIINYRGSFGQTVGLTNGIPQLQLESLRWRKMILHDYNTVSKAGALRDFIFRYSDNRIMRALYNIITVRESYLNLLPGAWTAVQSHLSDLSHTEDIELVAILAVKYSYFVRNIMFHSEIPDSTFKVKKTSEDMELELLSNILESLIFELIKAAPLLRNV